MTMTVVRVALSLIVLCPFILRTIQESDDSCRVRETSRPTSVFHGRSVRIDVYPPPYSFTFIDSVGRESKEYSNEVFKVRLSGITSFRGFVIQGRRATAEGILIDASSAGRFIQEQDWGKDGIQFDQCAASSNSSITHSDDKEKYSIEAKWQALDSEGPIQFVITVIQTPDTYWTHWQPPTGFVVQSKVAEFSDQEAETGIELTSTSSFNAQTSLDTTTSLTIEDTTTEFVEEHSTTTSKGSLNHRFNISVSGGRFAVRVVETRTKVDTRKTVDTESDEESEEDNNPQEVTSSPLQRDLVLQPPPQFKVGEDSGENEEDGAEKPLATSSQLEVTYSQPAIESTTTTEVATTETPSRWISCDSVFCNNHGACYIDPNRERSTCSCEAHWTGERCAEPDHCYEHKCQHDATCVSNYDHGNLSIYDHGNYSCRCQGQWAGKYCDRPCPHDICQQGGNCTIDAAGNYGCECPTGYTGQFCQINVDDCVHSDCLNGAECVDKLNDFECHCAPGYMGTKCETRCRDIYKSCAFWGDPELCKSFRSTTKFYDIHCPVTCGLCEYNETMANTVFLAPVLTPFERWLGKWTLNSTSQYRFPLDFKNATAGFYETLEITPMEVPMFDTPSVSFLTRAHNNVDTDDEHVTVGFLMLGPGTTPLKVSLMTTGNQGVTTLEEGEMDDNKMDFKMVYVAASPGAENMAPAQAKRRLSLKGPYLQEIVERSRARGQNDYFTKYYIREASYEK